MSHYRSVGKRLLDIVIGAALLVLTAPLLAVLIVLIRLTMGIPTIYRQDRPGRNGELFALLKLRTMNVERDRYGELLADDARLTWLGRRVRAASLDELPQLWNVLKGDMSLVGPRPLLKEYLPRYTAQQNRRHEVRPGMTGWAQVNGRQSIMFSRRLELDVWYVDHLSFMLDMKIIWLSVGKVLTRRGMRCGQSVLEVDDLGLHDETRAAGRLADGTHWAPPPEADRAA